MIVDDILRARLETVGVEEHRLVMETSEFSVGDPWFQSLKRYRVRDRC